MRNINLDFVPSTIYDYNISVHITDQQIWRTEFGVRFISQNHKCWKINYTSYNKASIEKILVKIELVFILGCIYIANKLSTQIQGKAEDICQ